MSQDNNKLTEGDHWASEQIEYFRNSPILNKLANYLKKMVLKLVETLMSVKVWIIFTVIGLTAWLRINGHISGDNLSSIWIGVVTPVAIMRESFKISRVFSDIKQKAMDMVNKQ